LKNKITLVIENHLKLGASITGANSISFPSPYRIFDGF